MRYEVDAATGVILTTATGTLTDDDILEHKRALLGDPEVRPGMSELSDVRGVTDLAVTPDGIRMFTSFDRVHTHATTRLAIVAAKDFAFGTARMYQMRDASETVGVFRCIEEARSWLSSATAE